MAERTSAAPWVPDNPTLDSLREAAAGCQGCDLYKTGTQTVFGEGAQGAEVMFVGEQPGDKEDKAGRPFVGPAGQLLDRALEEAGVDRTLAYVTNVVKHFKWTPSGKRRIHKKPSAREDAACRPWLEAELEVVQPKIVVCLGATAAQSLLGKDFKITKQRGQFFEGLMGPVLTATVHPSSILRARDDASRSAEMAAFVDDLRLVRKKLEELTG